MTGKRRLTAKDFDQELLELYNHFAHGRITKREFFDSAAKFAIGGVTVAGLLDMLSPDYALAQQVAPDDPDIVTSRVTYPSPNGTGDVDALLVKPAGASAPLGAVLVVHENRGLNPYVEDVARRVGKAGFIALAPDGLTSVGGYPGTDDEAREMQRALDPQELLNDFFAGYEYLAGRDDTTKIGVVGFCYGGFVTNAIAVAYPELDAAAPFYGGNQPSADDIPDDGAAMLLHYAENDNWANAGIDAYVAALEAKGREVASYVYPGTGHGFHNDTTPRYDEAAARQAWQATLALFRRTLVEA